MGLGHDVLLCSADVAFGRWEEAAGARKMLRDQGIRKETGLSRIEEESWRVCFKRMVSYEPQRDFPEVG